MNRSSAVYGGMEKAKTIFMIIFIVLCVSSCSGQAPQENDGSVCVASWNVQNLFNAVLDGGEYEEYKPASGWNQVMYERRLSNAAKVLSCLPDAGGCIIILNEIEGPDVAEDLIKACDTGRMGLRWYACTRDEGCAVQSAVLSSLPVTGARIHAVGEGLRPILEVEIECGQEKLFVLAVHFKSNLEGVQETAEARARAAAVVNRVSHAIGLENPGCLVMVCGDMNDECWENRTLGRSGVLRVSESFSRDSWYCFWMDSSRPVWPSGSYLYGGVWRNYDNILLSQSASDGSGLEFDGAGVVFEGIIRTVDSRPAAWNRNLLTGVSDHLPVWVRLSPSSGT